MVDQFFFVLSKLAWALLSPTNLIILFVTLATVALWIGAYRLAKVILLLTVIATLAVTLYPVGDSLIYPLESRFSKPAVLPTDIDGIILLGGGEDLKRSLSWQTAELNAGGDRYIGTANLAKYYPNSPVIFTGGNNFLTFDGQGNDVIARSLLTAVGIEPERLLIESQARNTYENMLLIQPLLPKLNGRYLLVTSAFHMPRSVGIARQQGLDVIPYPVDYRSNTPALRQWSVSLYDHLGNLEIAWREWVGLTVYYFTDKTARWFPSPEPVGAGQN